MRRATTRILCYDATGTRRHIQAFRSLSAVRFTNGL